MRLSMIGNYNVSSNIYIAADFEPYDPDSVTVGFYWVKGSDTPPASGTAPYDSKTFTRGTSEIRQVHLPYYGEGMYYVYYTLDGGSTWRKLGEFYLFDPSNVVLVTTTNPVCSCGTGVAIVNYNGRIFVNYSTVPIVDLPIHASHAVVEIWCQDTNKVFVGLFNGPFSNSIAVTPDLTPPVSFSFDITFNKSVTDDMVDAVNKYLSGVLSVIGVYKVSDNTIRVVASKSGPGFPVAAIIAAALFGASIAAILFGAGYLVNAFSNLQRQQAVAQFLNQTLPSIIDKYLKMVNNCLQISDTETRMTCLKVVSQTLDSAINAGKVAIENSNPTPPQQQPSISQWLSQNWWVVVLALLALLLLARR